MTLDERLSEAAAALRERVEPQTVSLEKRRAAKRHGRRVAAVLVLLLVAIVTGALVLLRDAGSSPRVGVSGGSGALTVTTTMPGPRPVIVRPTPSRVPPEGWQTIDYQGLRLFLPPAWTVLEHGCPGASRTLAIGDPPPTANCAPAAADSTWFWLRPLGPALEDLARACWPGGFNALWGCQYVDPGSSTETWFVEGLDVAAIGHPSQTDGADYRPIHDAMQYADDRRPEATDAYHLEEALEVARDFVAGYVAGDCATVARLAGVAYDGGCPDAIPDAHVGAAFSTSDGGLAPVQSGRVRVEPGRAFDVQLQHEWSFSDRRGHWRVAHISEADPNAPPPQPTSQLPDCVGVVNLGGERVGCIERGFLDSGRPPGPEFPYGFPVRNDNGELVGYMPADSNFVPLALADRLDEVRACDKQLISLRLNQRDRVTNQCRDLLVAMGLPASELDR